MIVEHLEGIITPVAVSAATWFWVKLKDSRNKGATEHIAFMAMLHTQLFSDGMKYLSRGYITTDELEDYNLIFESYRELGGNGTGEEIHKRVSRLRIEASAFGIVEAAKRKHEAGGK